MINVLLNIVLLVTSLQAMAQTVPWGDSANQEGPFILGIFADTYYSYDFNKPASHAKPGFLYSHNRHNEFAVNLAFLKAAYKTEKMRSILSLATGTYMNANYAAEPGVLKNIFEANVGARISRTANLWVDAGIFASHIGYESAHSPSCWTLTRSIAAENSPYYETGAKITYSTKNDKWVMSGLILNGWQRIQRVEGNNTPAFGTQVSFKPNSETTINWSTFVGNDKPDSVKQWRYFNDFYGIFQFTEKFGLTLGMDIGQEQQSKGSSTLNTWYTPTVVIRFTPGNNLAIAARCEYYSDEKGVIISTGTTNGFKTLGTSLNVDRKINDNIWWRTEVRNLSSKDAIFTKGYNRSKNNTFITTSFAIAF